MNAALTSRVAIVLTVVGLAAVGLAVGFAVTASSRADGNAGKIEADFVRAGMADQIDRVSREQESITIWDDAVTQARAADQQWLAENMGEWMKSYFGHDRAYVLDANGVPVYAMADGKTVMPPSNLADDGGLIATVFRDVKKQAAVNAKADTASPTGELTSRIVAQFTGRPALVSAKLIVPFSERLSVGPGDEYVHVAVKFLDGVPLQDIGKQYRVEGLRFVPVGSALDSAQMGVPLNGSDGVALGELAWIPDRPGTALLKSVGPGFLAAALLVAGIAFFMFRGLQRAAVQVQASESHSRFLALHDALTGLPNRLFFDEKLDEALGQTKRSGASTSVLYLDLDRFKSVNDSLGHRVGDELIREATNRLRWEVQDLPATVARVGGDEFAIVVPPSGVDVRALADRLIAALSKPFKLLGDQVHIGVSVGIATAPEHAKEREELVRKADIALYEAKKKGRGRYSVFAEDMDDILRQRRRVEEDLRTSMTDGTGLHLVYQPLYGPDGRVIGAEALLRWRHSVHGGLPADFVINIAEEAGLIVQLGDWILRQACAMVARVPVPWIAVNVSALQLREKRFAQRLLGILAETGVKPERIQIEVTEGVLIEDPVVASATLQELRRAGVRVALDDFGTGYSSMSYLRHYSIDKLKIDRSFTNGLSEKDGHAIVAAIIDMAGAMNLDVVAEGVETSAQRDALSRLGCNSMQGYFFSRPLKEDNFLQLFEAANAAATA